ncbi:sensor histidine kinase [Paenibacillus sp. 481]|uniref:sensor histidine kinase n=1 Tax=Paenibacillus sp. 481 TaxID=2835869 RepID=UPI001E3817D8|nr:HAMP domain-containing sensor histidine kinase [Paenibacillus sp. 481]UHA74846.1 HAMP domain-containing histidine kinase [Paenibacillus sp. 481]
MKQAFSLNWKFTLFIVGLLLFTIGLLSFFVLKGVHEYQTKQREVVMQRQTDFAHLPIRELFVTESRLDSQAFMQLQGQKLAVEIGATSGLHVMLYNLKGELVGDSLPMAGKKSAIDEALQRALQNQIAYYLKGDMLNYFAPVQGMDAQIGVIHFQASSREHLDFFQNLFYLFLGVGAFVLTLSLVLGLLYMNRHAKAIIKLKMATDQIRQGKFLTSPILRRQDELGALSDGIFEMSAAIQTNIKTQRNFINNISHEFKTPLTSIKAYTDLLDMYEDDPNLIREGRAAIAKESERLYDLVDKVLKLAALDKYEFEQHPEQVELHSLLEDVCSRMKGKAGKFGITITTQLESAVVWADRESMLHMFINLLDNAIKYNTEHGTVTVTNRIVQQQVEIEFRDTGIGIPLEQQAHIFEPFYTVNKDRARQYGGSGLGLSLVQHLVEQQHGHIRVEGVEGQGTSFIVTLPIQGVEKFTSWKQVETLLK